MVIKTLNPNQTFQESLDMLIIPVTKNKPPLLPLSKNDNLFQEMHRHAKLEELSQANAEVIFYPTSGKAKRIALISDFEKIGPQYAKVKSLGLFIPGQATESQVIQAVVSLQKAWHDSKITAEKKETHELLIFAGKKFSKVLNRAKLIAEGVELVKQLSNAPANFMTPVVLENEARELAKQFKLKFKSLNEDEMSKLSMGGILGVSKGSDEEARLIIVEANPASSAGGPKAKKTLALVGKGITFDSGGISLKHSKSLAEMKHDMTGGACVLALVVAAAQMKLPYRVVGVIAATENLPSGKALKPGDVITAHNGKTIEVLNTDAEGRLVLADALSYVQKKYQPQAIIDIATLTSAIITSLGTDITGAFGNSSKLNQQLLSAASQSGEHFHFMPLHQKYRENLPSKIADLRNVASGRSDALFAALFLQEFIEKQTPWLHLDIAGTSWNNNGATGACVPTLIKMFEKLKL